MNKLRKQAGLPPLPKTTVIDAPLAKANEALAKTLWKEFEDWLRANPDAPMSFKIERLTRMNRVMWRAAFPTE